VYRQFNAVILVLCYFVLFVLSICWYRQHQCRLVARLHTFVALDLSSCGVWEYCCKPPFSGERDKNADANAFLAFQARNLWLVEWWDWRFQAATQGYIVHKVAPRNWRWWRGVVRNAFRLKRSYSTPGPVSTAMGDCLPAGKPSRCEACQLGRLSLLPSVGR